MACCRIRAEIAVADTNCIDLEGNGTDANPVTATPILDPDVSNILSCGPSGLLASAALVFAPTAGTQSNTTRTNWLGGLPAVSGLYANNQGDPTSTVAGDYSAILGGSLNLLTGARSAIIGTNRSTVFGDDSGLYTVGGSFAYVGANRSAILGGTSGYLEIGRASGRERV